MKAKVISTYDAEDKREHPTISLNQEYYVIGVESDCFRIVDNNRSPILIPKKLFGEVSQDVPSYWVRTDYEDGEYYIDPPELSAQYFYEDYFDHDPVAIETYDKYLKESGIT